MKLKDFLDKKIITGGQFKSLPALARENNLPAFISVNFPSGEKYYMRNVIHNEPPKNRKKEVYVTEYVEIRTDAQKNECLHFSKNHENCEVFMFISPSDVALDMIDFLRFFMRNDKDGQPIMIISAEPDYFLKKSYYIFKDGNYQMMTFGAGEGDMQGTLLGSVFGYDSDNPSRHDAKWVKDLMTKTKVKINVKVPIIFTEKK